MNFKEIGSNTRDWVDSTHKDYWRALVNTALTSGFHKLVIYVTYWYNRGSKFLWNSYSIKDTIEDFS